MTGEKFQSTRPIRGATSPDMDTCINADISIHAPHTGRDIQSDVTMDIIRAFQSTRPIRGATFSRFMPFSIMSHFNPRAPYGARLGLERANTHDLCISIHAPHTGRDDSFLFFLCSLIISIHAPHTGRDLLARAGLCQLLHISIHAPHTGRDFVGHGLYLLAAISIHAPHTGRDVRMRAGSARLAGISIHAPHTGRDQEPPEGRHDGQRISIHAPHTGRDDVYARYLRTNFEFQSTRPIRGATDSGTTEGGTQ